MDATEKTLSVLDALDVARAGGASRLGDIAARAQLPKSTTHRILRRLVDRGYARSVGDGVYVLGPRVLTMASDMLHELDATVVARPIVRALHGEVGHTVHFAALSDDEAVYLDKLVDPGLPYQFASRVGGRIPLHCTAIGKALLAAMGQEEARALLARRRPARRTPKTLTSPGAIRAELHRTHERGYAIDDEENERNIRCVGAAVLDLRGRPAAAISVTALTVELSVADAFALGPRVMSAARALSEALGGGHHALDPARLPAGGAQLTGRR
jgi:IclR family acetate operon transcriptional repressor